MEAEEAPMSPISCAECGSIYWSMGDCQKCGKPLEIQEDENDVPTARGSDIEPVAMLDEDPEARAAAEEEARRKAMEDPEMRRKMLRSRIRAMQENRGRITTQNEVRDARGRRVRGARQERHPKMTFTERPASGAPIDVSAPDLV